MPPSCLAISLSNRPANGLAGTPMNLTPQRIALSEKNSSEMIMREGGYSPFLGK
jgi:hypothetical protein